jgi:hypothetical protein
MLVEVKHLTVTVFVLLPRQNPETKLKQSPNLKTFYGVQESIPSLAESILGILKCLQIRAQETTVLYTVNFFAFCQAVTFRCPNMG